MNPRASAKAVVVGGIGRVLRLAGYEGAELELARRDAAGWAKARVGAVRWRRGVIGGVGALVSAPGRVELRPIEVVDAGDEQTTVEVLATAISAGTERAEWLRLPNLRPPLPYEPGYSGVGRVLASGPGPHHVDPGSRVAVARLHHVSVATVPSAYALPVPAGVPDADAALVYLAMIAGWGVERAALRSGEPLCVIGAGPIGALAHRLAMLDGPGPVTVVARTRRREASTLAAGASAFVTVDGHVDELAPVVIEATGDPEAISTAVRAVTPGGTIVLLGSPWAATEDAPLRDLQRKRARLVGAHISSLATHAKTLAEDPFRRIGLRFLHALGDGRLAVADLAGEPADPRELRLVYKALAAGDVLAAHVDWTRLPRAERVRATRVLALPKLPPRAPAVAALAATTRRASPSGRLRFAVIGCGDIGHKNARAVARAGNAVLVASFDTAPGLASTTAAAFGGRAVTSIVDALDRDHVDAVVVSVPHDLHEAVVEQAAAAGVHVVMEKPLAHDLDSARRLVDVADRAGVVLSVCFPYRYEPPVVAAKSLIGSGVLGELRGANVVFHDDQPDGYWRGGFSGRVASDWRLRRSRSGGGVLIMSLVHQIDFLRHLLGVEIDTVSAATFVPSGAEVEDEVAMTVTFDGGAIGTILGATSTRGRPPGRFEVWGETGTVRLVPDPAVYTERAVDGVDVGRWCALPPEDDVDVRRVFIERFVDAVLEGTPPDVTAEDGLVAQAVVAAAYHSAATSRPVSVRELLVADR